MNIPTIEDFNRLETKVEKVTTMLTLFSQAFPMPKVIKVKDIARIEQVSVSSLYGSQAYLLPRFGQNGFPDEPRRWELTEYLEWRSLAVEKRKEMFHQHLEEERLQALEGRA